MGVARWPDQGYAPFAENMSNVAELRRIPVAPEVLRSTRLDCTRLEDKS